MRSRRIVVGIGLVLGSYLAFVWLDAPTSGQGCHDCYEWHGRYAEWRFVALFTALNAAGLVLGGALGAAVRLALSRQSAK